MCISMFVVVMSTWNYDFVCGVKKVSQKNTKIIKLLELNYD